MKSKWIFKRKDMTSRKMRLFCLPYAGGGAIVYRNWQNKLSEDIEVCPIQLPGRENRLYEPLIDNSKEMVDAIYEGIKDYLDCPFAIFGHSMGGVLAYELALKLEKNHKKPKVLFMSATTLDFDFADKTISDFDDEHLKRYLIKSGGTVSEALMNKDFCNIYYPIIRNDYKIIESYKCPRDKVSCEICAFASKNDTQIPCCKTEDLKRYTNDFKISYFNGNHFFLRSEEDKLCDFINKELKERGY